MTRMGWCPSVATPMDAGDGLLVRIKPIGSTISSKSLRAIAEVSQTCGNGLFDLTNRSNLQVRGLRPESVETFAAVARMHGLASEDAAFEEIRNVAADPLGSDDPDALFDSHAIARAIEHVIGREPALRALPPKFGVLVDCAVHVPVPETRADIVVRDRGAALTVGLGGGVTALLTTPEEAPELVRRLMLAFLELADAATFRMRELVAGLGEAAVIAQAGLAAAPAWVPGQARDMRPGLSSGDAVVARGSDQAGTCAPDLNRGPDTAREMLAEYSGEVRPDPMYAPPPPDSPLGFVPFRAGDRGAFLAGAPRGRIDAATLSAVAGFAERFADATVRLTPWRALALVPVRSADAAQLIEEAVSLGLIADPAEPRRALRGHDFEPAGGRTAARQEALSP